MENDKIILVNEHDDMVGIMDKMEAHRQGLLHRAFSIFIFNGKGEILLQQRALSKYHSGGLWTNACCSHPEPGEDIEAAAHRRLVEEMGFDTPLIKLFDFIYKAELDKGLVEHEFDHVFTGEFDGTVNYNREEVMDYCFKDFRETRYSLQTDPQKYTAWFRLALPRVEDWWNRNYKNKVEGSH